MAKQRLKEHRINRDWCKGCGICVHFCPGQVLELDSLEKVVAMRPQACICCRLCELRCPDLAIEIITQATDKAVPDTDPASVSTSAPDLEPACASRAELAVSLENINPNPEPIHD